MSPRPRFRNVLASASIVAVLLASPLAAAPFAPPEPAGVAEVAGSGSSSKTALPDAPPLDSLDTPRPSGEVLRTPPPMPRGTTDADPLAEELAALAGPPGLDPPVPLPETAPLPTVPAPEAAPVAPAFPPALGLPPAHDVAPLLPPPASGMAGALLYRGCGQVSGGAAVCTPVPVPFGTPLALDVDGQPTTGAAGMDVLLEVVPLLGPANVVAGEPLPPLPPPGGMAGVGALVADAAEDATRPGLFVAVRMLTLPGPGELPARALPARVWVEYVIPDDAWTPSRLLRVGLDGTAARLPAGMAATMRIPDFEALVGGRLQGRLDVAFDDPGARATAFAQVERLGAAPDPVSVAVALAPPVNATAELDVLLDGTFAQVTTDLADPSTATVDVQTLRGAATTRVVATAAPLPEASRIVYEQRAGGVIAASFEGSAGIPMATLWYERKADNLRLAGDVTAMTMPDRFAVVLDPKPAAGSLVYAASGTIGRVYGSVSRTENGATTTDLVDITNLPPAARVDWSLAGTAATITVEASARFGPAYVVHSTGAGQPAFGAGAQELPPWLRVEAKGKLYTLDARAAAFRATGTDDVDGLAVTYASDGKFLVPLPGDHVQFEGTSSATRGTALVDGLRSARVDLTKKGDFTAEVFTAQPRDLRFRAVTPDGSASGLVSKTPTWFKLAKAGTTVRFEGSAAIAHAEAVVSGASVGTVNVVAKGLPNWMQVVYDLGAKRVNYTAGGRLTEVTATATGLQAPLGPWDVDLALAGVAPAFEARWSDGRVLLEAAQPVDRVALVAQNALALMPPCPEAASFTNYVCALVNPGAERYGVRLAVAKLQRFHAVRLDSGALLEADGGDARPLGVRTIVLLPGSEIAVITATLSKVPAGLKGTFGPLVQVVSKEPFDLSLDAAWGHVNALALVPAPPAPELGVAMRDGANPSAPAQKALRLAVRLTEMPTLLEVGKTAITAACPTGPCVQDAYIVNAQGIRAKTTNLSADVDLRVTLPKPLYAKFWVWGANGSGKDFRAVFSTYEVGQEKVVNVAMANSQLFGPLAAHVAYGEHQGRVDMIPTPATLTALLRTTSSGARVTYAASEDVFRAYLAYGKGVVPLSTFGSAAQLTDVPRSVDLTLGRNAAGPEIQYAANADTLDVDLSIGPELFGDLRARLEAHATNLGRSVKGTLANGKVSITSTPPTPLLNVTVWASYNLDRPTTPGSQSWTLAPFAWAELSWGLGLKLDATVEQLTFRITDLETWSLQVGVPLVIEGAYDLFSMTWGGLRYTLDPDLSVVGKACGSLAGLSDCEEVVGIRLTEPITATSLLFYTANDHGGLAWNPAPWEVDLGCFEVDISAKMDTRPHMHGYGPGISTYGTRSTALIDDGKARWFALPDVPVGGLPRLGTTAASVILAKLASDGWVEVKGSASSHDDPCLD